MVFMVESLKSFNKGPYTLLFIAIFSRKVNEDLNSFELVLKEITSAASTMKYHMSDSGHKI